LALRPWQGLSKKYGQPPVDLRTQAGHCCFPKKHNWRLTTQKEKDIVEVVPKPGWLLRFLPNVAVLRLPVESGPNMAWGAIPFQSFQDL
jgi:hypothetical protein